MHKTLPHSKAALGASEESIQFLLNYSASLQTVELELFEGSPFELTSAN